MRKAIFVLAIVAILVSLAVYLASPVSANTPDASISDAENMVPAEPVEPETVPAPVLEPSPVSEPEIIELEPEPTTEVVTLPFTLCYVTGSDVREREAPVDGKIVCKHQRGDVANGGA